ncbi:ribosomal protein S5 domain 2-like protein [Coniophora puteana RWD-64-598 SS2]|uniref:Ribosomal protein S5 domain 2-like protein n=1 Tax=Coniophora puteana (strain RWD-64-598) TaxID=741705 RepID=A0A5M3MEI6_CONPW|nr:ribosomal protein S5 domain 2-like protein [Coniophora puteana RWD-64-598 SS2]EIW77330.1 ribosomal protein S5 domain 2-like protein [Coniophora puteana RWD-64-598 SS2]
MLKFAGNRPPSPSIAEKDFLQDALRKKLRLDGRKPMDLRPISFSFGPELGWVDCSLGKTRVLAQVDAKMVKPLPERPYEGLITIHSEISPMAGPEYDTARPSEEEIGISRMLDKIVKRSDALDKESLCVLAGQRVWHLRLTVHFISDAGNMLDCAVLASMVALRHFRRPEVEVIGDEVIIHSPSERAPVPLALHHIPLCLTFAFFPPPSNPTSKNNEVQEETPPPIVLADPNTLEERLADGTLSVALNVQRELCVLHKAGGLPLEPAEVMKVVQRATFLVKELDELVEARLREDWEGRHVEVR